MKKFFTITLASISLFAISGCEPTTQAAAPVKKTQAQKAEETANSITFTENSEIDNIKKRLELTSQPGLLGFIILLNDAGQPILYEGVKGKITSSGKRLTRPYDIKQADCGEFYCDRDYGSPSDEGTWGSSSPYVFYWNTEGVYRQWSGDYLYSDKPFRLQVEPLVIGVTTNGN